MQKKALLFLAVLTLCCAMLAESKYILSAKRLNSTDVAITCNNGGDPTGVMVGKTLIISCGH